MKSGIKTLIVDDSGFMRILISDILRKDREINLLSTASNGKDGVEKALSLKPDVVITDMVMPQYDGLYVVKELMEKFPLPIVVLSSLEKTNPKIFDALGAGAFDFVLKPRKGNDEGYEKLLQAIKAASGANISPLQRIRNARVNTNRHKFQAVLNYDLIAIGASTGGPGAVEALIQKLPDNLALPVVIGQHMPHRFIESFAARLNALTPHTVKIAENLEHLEPGIIYLLPGTTNTEILRDDTGRAIFHYTRKLYREFNNPSIDCLMESAGRSFGKKSIGVILTGMGKDGTEGLEAIRKTGGLTLAQNKTSSIVFGMPQSAIQSGAAIHTVSLKDIPGFIISAL